MLAIHFWTTKQKARLERLKNLVCLHASRGRLSSANESHKIFINSMPKSGTNLLIKTIQLIPGIQNTTISLHSEMHGTPWQSWQPIKQRLWRSFPSVNTSYNLARLSRIEIDEINKTANLLPIGGFHNVYVPEEALSNLLSFVPKGWFADGHMPFSETFERLLKWENFKMVFIIRDPRDIITSEINFFLNEKRLVFHPYYKILGREQGLISIIEGFTNKNSSFPNQPNFRKILLEYLPWLSKPYVYVTRFEDLVGPQGGGTIESQVKQIMRIAQHLNIHLTEMEATYIGHNLFGGTPTFYKGVAGSWKTEFSQEVKLICKQNVGDLLIELGYEKDYDW